MFKVDKKYENSDVAVTIRFTEELYAKLKAVAESEDISFNKLVLQCCDYAMDNYSAEE